MQISQWTTEIIVISVIIAVACCVIGYFVAALRHGNRLGQLTSQLGQAQQAQGLLTQQLAQAQEQLKAAEQQCYGQQVEAGKVQTQLEGAKSSCKSWRRN